MEQLKLSSTANGDVNGADTLDTCLSVSTKSGHMTQEFQS